MLFFCDTLQFATIPPEDSNINHQPGFRWYKTFPLLSYLSRWCHDVAKVHSEYGIPLLWNTDSNSQWWQDSKLIFTTPKVLDSQLYFKVGNLIKLSLPFSMLHPFCLPRTGEHDFLDIKRTCRYNYPSAVQMCGVVGTRFSETSESITKAGLHFLES